MGLNLVVLVKQVPDTQNITGDAMKEDGTVNRAALPAVFNPEDLFALEAALSLKDEIPDTKISVITMGPPPPRKSYGSASTGAPTSPPWCRTGDSPVPTPWPRPTP